MAGAPHLAAFIDAAIYFIGAEDQGDSANTPANDLLREIYSLAGMSGCSWCAIFIAACAEKAGIGNVLIAKHSGAGWIQEDTVLSYGGEWIEGPYMNGGVAVTPHPGDIISFTYDPQYSGYGHASHVGIVEKVEDGKVCTIEGNTSNCCARREYALDCNTINMYVRPDWAAVGDDVDSYLRGLGQYTTGPLYQNRNDRHDMTLREVGYLDGNYKLTNKKTGIAISVINYTTALGDIYDKFAPATSSTSVPRVDTSQLSGQIKIVMDILLRVGYSASGASAITACLYLISKIDTKYSHKLSDATYAYGIYGWYGDTHKRMKQRVGLQWNTNLSGQLQFLLDDLATNYAGLAQVIKLSELSESEAQTSAQSFLALYDTESNGENYRKTIGNTELVKTHAKDIYNKLIITKGNILGNVTDVIKDIDGNVLNAKYSTSVPSYVNQTGIIDDYTSYSYWYHGWGSGTVQRELADIWAYQGCPCDKGVATIDGYYLIAVRPKFGRVGDVVVVELEGGIYFSAIIADEKGEDAESEWGHVKGNGISIIEWQRIVTYNGEVLTEGASASLVDGLGFDDWLGKDIVNITNYGSFL